MTTVVDVISQMAEVGITGLQPFDLQADGKLHRFRPEGAKSKRAWYCLHECPLADGGTYITGAFGDWSQGSEPYQVKRIGYKQLSPEEQQEIKRRTAAAKKAREEEKARAQEVASRRAASVWVKLPETKTHAYLEKKRVKSFGLRVGKKRGADGPILISMQDIDGRIWGLQRVYPRPLKDENQVVLGDKFFWPKGCRIEGLFYPIGDLVDHETPIVVCEGYATGASIHEATGWPVFVAFNAGNLSPVCEALRSRHRNPMVIAGDDDFLTTKPVVNPGRTKAFECAKRYTATIAVLPEFKNRGDNSWTDFNDLHVQEGIGEVKRQLLSARDDGKNWKDRFLTSSNGNRLSIPFNVQLVLMHDPRWRGVLGYCELSYRIMKLKEPPFPNSEVGEWADEDTASLRIWLAENYAFTPKSADADDAITFAARFNKFHPVRDYLNGLKWDGVKRIDKVFTTYCGAADDKYTQAVAVKWFLGAVARAMAAPIKVDNVLILEGKQGLGKSTFLSVLGGPWYSDTHFNLGEKDGYQQMQGVWICELAELDSFNKAESTRAKQFFASAVDRYRPSYGRRAKDFARQCVFAGSTNQDSYLKDATGNRRYWPVHLEYLSTEPLKRDRDQLWAEAVYMYKEGGYWHVTPEELSLFEDEQESRYDQDVWEQVIHEWLLSLSKSEVTMHEIFAEGLKFTPDKMKPPEQKRVGQIMARLNWKKTRKRLNGGREHVYVAPEGWKEHQKITNQVKADFED